MATMGCVSCALPQGAPGGEAVGAVVQPEFYPWSNGLWPGAASARGRGPFVCSHQSTVHRLGWSDSHNGVNKETVPAEVRLQRPDAASRLVLREPQL